PQWKPILKMTWTRGSAYLKRAGMPIVVISAILWLLTNFGLGSHQPPSPNNSPPPVIAPSDIHNSFAAQIGQTMEPVLKPMGVDWRVGVGLISAFFAREVFVSSMAIVFNVSSEGAGAEKAGDDEEETQKEGLLQQMRSATFRGGSKMIFSSSTIVGLMVFFFFSLQCASTVAVVRKETGSWRIAGLQVVFYTGLGYLAS